MDKRLVWALRKYGNHNWYKIISSLYSKPTENAQLRWKGWLHPIIKKASWAYTEDIILYQQIQYISKFTIKNLRYLHRTYWQRFFRIALFENLDYHGQIIRHGVIQTRNKKKKNKNSPKKQEFKYPKLDSEIKNYNVLMRWISVTDKIYNKKIKNNRLPRNLKKEDVYDNRFNKVEVTDS